MNDVTSEVFTEREVALTGPPSHDRALRIATSLNSAKVAALLVIPT